MYFLVDFENVRSGGLRGVDYHEGSDNLTMFFSNAVHSFENRYLEDIEKSGCHFDTCKLKNTGKNGCLKEKLAGVDIDVFQERYEERMRLQEILRCTEG